LAINAVTRPPDNTASRKCIDLDADGLLDGVDGSAWAARLKLREAVANDRVALFPSERLLHTGDKRVPRYTAEELTERAGVPVEDLRITNAALGLPLAETGIRIHTEVDVDLGPQLGVALAAGLSLKAVSDDDRNIARGLTQIVAASLTDPRSHPPAAACQERKPSRRVNHQHLKEN
jgi:hypothetical protein